MTHTPERWHVGYEQEYDTGRCIYDGVIFTVTGGDQLEKIAENVRGEKTAHRIVALWNMAERLGLSTEEIESGNVETKLKAAPDMLRALEEVMGELDYEGLPCPLCGIPSTIGHRHDCIWHVVESAVRKARGEE